MSRFWILAVAVVASSLVLESAAQEEDNCTKITSRGCDDCVQSEFACFWCDTPNPGVCLPVNNAAFLTDLDNCPGYQWKWGQCTLNGIVIAVLIAIFCVFVLIVICALTCCIACFCRRKRKERLARAEYKYNRERDAIRVEHERKKEDKKARREEIKKKYGLFEDGGATHDSGYQAVD